MSERISGINHVGFTVTDLDRSVKFYTEVLECTVVVEQEKKGGYLGAIVGYPEADVRMAHVQPPGNTPRLELFEYRAPRSAPTDLEPRNVGNAHVCFVVDDLPKMYERLLEHNVTTFSEPIEIDTGVNAGGFGLYAKDPDGITIELFQPPKSKQ